MTDCECLKVRGVEGSPPVVSWPRADTFGGVRPGVAHLSLVGRCAGSDDRAQRDGRRCWGASASYWRVRVRSPAQCGHVAGTVTDVRTATGDDHWDVDVRSLFPERRFHGRTLMGLNTATGIRNGADYPAFFSADVAVTRSLSLLSRRVGVGLQPITSRVITTRATSWRTWAAPGSASSATRLGVPSHSSWGWTSSTAPPQPTNPRREELAPVGSVYSG